MMEVCRICLSNAPSKYLHQLQTRCDKSGHIDHVQILKFCLDIQVTRDMKLVNRLCMKCFKKIVCFYKFKSMALKNNARLRAKVKESGIMDKNEEHVRENKVQDKNEEHRENKKQDKNEEQVRESEVQRHTNNELEVQRSKFKLSTYDTEEKDKKEIYYIEEDLVIIPQTNSDQNMEEDSLDYDMNYEQYDDEVNTTKVEENEPKSEEIVPSMQLRKTDEVLVLPQDVLNIKPECSVTKLQHPTIEEVMLVPQDILKIKQKGPDPKVQLPKTEEDIMILPQDILKIKPQCLPARKVETCKVCKKDFGDIAGHYMRMHRREQCKYVCNLCGARFHCRSHLELHGCKEAKDLPRPFQCDLCQRNYVTEKLLNAHKYFSHPKNKPYLCQFCSKTFATNYRLKIHLRIHTNEKPFKCEICEKTFKYHNAIYRHRFLHKEEKTFQCTQCGKSYFNASGLRNHMEYHKKEKDIPCRYCGALFIRYSQRATHELKEHNRGRRRYVPKAGSRALGKQTKATRVPGATVEYLCQLCSMSFTKKSLLSFHLKYHGQERPHKCTECPKSYLTTKGLEYHYQFAHTDNRQFQCTLCAKNFSSPKYLRQHMVSHREDKAKYQCKYCGVCFTREEACKAHEKKLHEKKEQTYT